MNSNSNFQSVVDYINLTVVKNTGKPILFGVHYDASSRINPYNYDILNNATASMHYMIFVGKTFKEGKEYLRFYDVGRSDLPLGTKKENLFEVD